MPRPPRLLLSALVATSSIVTLALVALGWRVLDQQRAIEADQARRQLESDADATAARIRERLALAGDRLSGLLSQPAVTTQPIAGATTIVASGDVVTTCPDGALPFLPAVPHEAVTPAALSAIETVEFASHDPTKAADQYRRLVSHSSDPRIRAGALLRLGRSLRKSGDFAGALAAYQQLAGLGAQESDELPAELAGLDGQRLTLTALHQADRAERISRQMESGLDTGRWRITRGFAEFYREQAGAGPRSDSWPVAAALADEWQAHPTGWPARGQSVSTHDGRRVLVLWRSSGPRIAAAAALLDRFVASPEAEQVAWRLNDAEGRLVAGARGAPVDAVTRVVGAAESPWTLRAWPAQPPTHRSSSGRAIVVMMGCVVAFVWGATHFMARAIRRESAVARLQSDFVAAVSHEFRSPLTSIRQMAEMLEMGRLPGEERRRQYYKTLARESARLQRLVETLLDFGRMEAGAQPHRSESIDLGRLVREVVRETDLAAREADARIDIEGCEPSPIVLADARTLSVALRNLIDNALKYAGASPIRVTYGVTGDHIDVDVIDDGPGVPRAEQRTIFDKFVRGRQAMDGNVQGTGVGLAIVRQIARAHDGEVQVISEPGHGSTFRITLPVVTSDALARERIRASPCENAPPREVRAAGTPRSADLGAPARERVGGLAGAEPPEQ